MAKKNEQPNQPQAVPTRGWFFPTLGKTVTAATYEEALTLAEGQKEEREDGDGNS